MSEGRVVTPKPLPIVCQCRRVDQQPVVHGDPQRNHWCIACGGYLGSAERFHSDGATCGCRECMWKSCVLANREEGGFIGTILHHTTIGQGYPEAAK